MTTCHSTVRADSKRQQKTARVPRRQRKQTRSTRSPSAKCSAPAKDASRPQVRAHPHGRLSTWSIHRPGSCISDCAIGSVSAKFWQKREATRLFTFTLGPLRFALWLPLPSTLDSRLEPSHLSIPSRCPLPNRSTSRVAKQQTFDRPKSRKGLTWLCYCPGGFVCPRLGDAPFSRQKENNKKEKTALLSSQDGETAPLQIPRPPLFCVAIPGCSLDPPAEEEGKKARNRPRSAFHLFLRGRSAACTSPGRC